MSEIKYKLLKELPFCPIGRIGVIDNESQVLFNGDDDNQYYYRKEEIAKLIEQGWIEEYKPKSQKEIAYEIIGSVQFDKDFDTLDRNDVQDCINKLLSKYEIKEK